jgi:hypothetical protein
MLNTLLSSKAFPQSWLEYNVNTGNQTTIPYSIVSTGNSSNTNSNQGILLPNYSSDTGRAFFPLDMINDPNAFPWRMAVNISGVTGILIDPYHVLTAGHIIDFSPNFINNLITPAYGQGNSPYGYARAEKLYLLSNYAQGTATDIGIIKLDRPIGALVGWSGVGYNNTDSYFTSNIFLNPNYPGADIYDGQLLYNWKGIFDAVYPDFVYSFRQGIVGMSGSPAFTKVNGNNVSYGILITSGIKFNRLTPLKYDGINKILNLNTPSDFDMIPLYTDVYPKTIKSGNQLNSLRFVVLNYSNQQKNNASFTANIYLSQDSLITTSDSLIGTYTFNENFQPESSVIENITQNLPTINSPSGTYWIGLIISGDNNTSDNTTKGYDVAKIIVNNNNNITISGNINSTQSNNGISGVTLNGFPTTVITDYHGYYEAEVPAGWSGTITPVKGGYSISPSNKNYNNVVQNTTDNYSIIKNVFTITGTVKMPVSQNGVWGMKVTGLIGEPITNNSGQYSASIYQGWSGYVNFQKNGWFISNPSINYNNVSSNISELITSGFLVKGLIYRGSGNPIKNVAFNGFPGGTVYSDSNGIYSKLLDSGWTGTVTPTNPGSTFDPANRTYTNLSTSYYYHNYSEIPKQVLNLKVFLSGAYSSGTDTMICKLKRNSFLPQIPNLNYSNNGIKFQYKLKPTDTVTQSFWNQNMKIVDWLAIEIVSTTNFHAIDTELALLRNDGRILNLNGVTLI